MKEFQSVCGCWFPDNLIEGWCVKHDVPVNRRPRERTR